MWILKQKISHLDINSQQAGQGLHQEWNIQFCRRSQKIYAEERLRLVLTAYHAIADPLVAWGLCSREGLDTTSARLSARMHATTRLDDLVEGKRNCL